MIPLVSRSSCLRVGVFHLAAAVVIGCGTLGAAQAATTSPPVRDTYITLALPGVVGDFTTVPNAPPTSIQVLSLSLGASCAGVNTCTPSVSNLSLLKAADSASPKLFLALVTNVVYPTALINFWQTPTTGTNYSKTFTIYLTQAKITTFQDGASEGGGPSESISLSFTTMALQDNVSGVTECYNVSSQATSNTLTC
jgi:type VI protein secretion system component Hcp